MLLVLYGIREDLVAATKAELFERIRRDSWREGLSIRALARKYGVHRRLVREIGGRRRDPIGPNGQGRPQHRF